MNHKLNSTEQYQNALKRVWDLMQISHPIGSVEYEELDLLVSLIEDYEDNVLCIDFDKVLVNK
ncbi:MAG: hypothetical protein EAZ85_00345 [Bacteroidetes bacterium]|nr:MAG: hypothetical protein EAZ85_00345 [Bacteroidota bacterium]TAG90332.1 MAG: hypothetical protein EAZ20_04620 [Bacteroidota bacterium]